MSEVFRKHYAYGDTIPILDTHVGMTCDLYEVTEKPAPAGPYIKAVFTATAGPMKSTPLIVEPLQDNESRVVHLSDIPVPVALVRTVDISLIFDLVNYRWTPSPDFLRENGLITFDLRLRAAFSLLGKSYTLQLDQRPCSLTLAKRIPQVPLGAGFEAPHQQLQGAGPAGAVATAEPAVHRGEGPRPSTIGNGAEISNLVTSQMDVEERLRQLSTQMLART